MVFQRWCSSTPWTFHCHGLVACAMRRFLAQKFARPLVQNAWWGKGGGTTERRVTRVKTVTFTLFSVFVFKCAVFPHGIMSLSMCAWENLRMVALVHMESQPILSLIIDWSNKFQLSFSTLMYSKSSILIFLFHSGLLWDNYQVGKMIARKVNVWLCFH